MKTRYFIFGTAICSMMGLGLTSCDNNKFLDVPEYNIVPAQTMFDGDENAKMALTGVYDMMVPDGDEATNTGDWGFKPNLFTGCHPTMDTQATGWDKDWCNYNWNANSGELNQGWQHAYIGISRANDFLVGLKDAENVSAGLKSVLEGEARALRSFFYHWLATTFGRVPMLAEGENYINTPTKAKASSYEEVLDFIIKDLEAAIPLLDWAPRDNTGGYATKGMALAYLGDCYMWMAYRCPDKAADCYAKAAAAFKQILDSKTYELNRSFTTLWDVNGVWDKEAIWEEVLDQGTDWGTWDGSLYVARMFIKYYAACPENGGWGSLYLSWDWYSSFEKGDKRRDGSACTGEIHNIGDYTADDGSSLKSDYCYGYNPYTKEHVGRTDGTTKCNNFHFYNGEYAPSIWSMKFWRNARPGWSGDQWAPAQIYWKRLPNVMLDYAECLFRLNGDNDATAWGLIDELRNRAFGNLEVGYGEALTAKYLPGVNTTLGFYGDHLDAYPIPFNDKKVDVTPAKDYYTALKAKKGFESPVWKIAVNEERRKEFNCEWSLRPDMQKSGYMEDHIKHNYPYTTPVTDLTNFPWTVRKFEFSERKLDMPIPSEEISRNPDCVQNEAY